MMELPTWTDPDKRKWIADHGIDADNVRTVSFLAQDGTAVITLWDSSYIRVSILYDWPACKLCVEV